jgi:hypothetical protein
MVHLSPRSKSYHVNGSLKLSVTPLLSRSPAESPSTRYTSHFAGSCSNKFTWQSTATHYGSLDHFTRFFSGVTCAAKLLLNNDSGIIWIFFQIILYHHFRLTYRRYNFSI